ncbi:iron uptake porin [Geminocystis sp. CENA526]|uniref:iron uptake porin n=1 Tax=Geminocystis sp. CENA526 TaxID=1355871 RepID=UPI003D6F40DB
MKKYSVATPAVIALAMVANGIALKDANANEISADATLQQISEYNQTQPMGQVTSVSQLRDVSPTDWAFEALRSLVENYGCIVGYPDRTFRGNRALSRYEFAAGLNACMQQMERLIASSQGVLREDIEKLKRLMAEFETELAALGARVDNLEGRVAFLEDHQFSTTTKLRGEVIFGLTAFGENSRGNAQTTLSDRVRLSLDSSFTGKDRLRVRLAAGNVPRIRTQTGNNLPSTQARLSFEQNTPDNNVIADKVFYTAPLGDKFRFWAGPMMAVDDIYRAYSPYTESGGTGALSRAMRYNPVLYRNVGEAGIAAQYKFNSTFDITASYLAGNNNSAADPSRGSGLFNGVYSAGVQLGINPNKNLGFGLGYMFAYDNANNIGGGLTPLGALPNQLRGVRVETHNVGIQGTWRVAEKFNVSGWGGYSDINDPGSNANADLWTFALNFSLLDLMKEGAVLNIGGGMLPYVDAVEGRGGKTVLGGSTSWIVEGNYRFPVTDNISITPGVYAVFNPNQDDSNNTAVVGVLRTVFQF